MMRLIPNLYTHYINYKVSCKYVPFIDGNYIMFCDILVYNNIQYIHAHDADMF